MNKPILIEELEPKITISTLRKTKTRMGKFLCDCGNNFITNLKNVEREHTKSCGCISKIKKPFKHRKFKTPNIFIKKDKFNFMEITRKNGKILYIKIDKEDISTLIKYKWVTNGIYVSSYINRKTILLHRFLLVAPKGSFVDHINRDTLDNRKKNLRICTPQQNQQNRLSAGYSLDTSRNKFIVSLKLKGKTKHIGRYITKKEALRARINAEKKYFGEFAVKRTL